MSKEKTITETKTEVLEKAAAKKIGANMIVMFGSEKHSRKVSMEEGDKILREVALYNKRPTEARKQTIIKLTTPEATKIKEAKEKTEAKIKGLKQQVKKEEKSQVKEVAKMKGGVQKEVTKSESEGKDFLSYTKQGVTMKGFEKIVMPMLLVNKITEFLKKNISIEPLLNFWSLCLLNSNEVARTRLFEYLSRHKFIITPSGYFVTYRMVKKTNEKDVFTDAHTGKFKIKIGQAVSIPRSECDEDGGRDCSKGLHVGSPDFIGISKGEGYDKQKGQVGTGYVDYSPNYGDQPIIAFVNPAHVVSIPNSETRKLRCCEYYPFKLTTPEEIISVEDSDYYVYENNYKKVELDQLMNTIGKENLKEYFSGNTNKERIATLQKKLDENISKLAGDGVISKTLEVNDIKDIIRNRVNILSAKFPTGVQL